MTKREFEQWLIETGFTTSNDYNYQQIGEQCYYFIKHDTKDSYAFIKEIPVKPYNMDQLGHTFEVIVSDWTDYNGWDGELKGENDATQPTTRCE